MRLSSAFVFVAFAFLTSAFLIHDDNRTSISLQRRLNAPLPTIEYHTGDGMVIRDHVEHNGEIHKSEVIFEPSGDPIEFEPRPALFPGEYYHRYTFVDFAIDSIRARDYYGVDGWKDIMWTLMFHNEGWIVFHASMRPLRQRIGYTLTMEHLFNGGYAQHFYKRDRYVLFYLQIPTANINDERWLEKTMFNDVRTQVEWLPAPAQHHRHGAS